MWVEDADGRYDYKYCEWYVDVLNEAMATKSTDTAIANIQAQGVEKIAVSMDEKAKAFDESAQEADGFATDNRYRFAAAMLRGFAAELRKEAGK